MSEDDIDLKVFLEERDALFRNPTDAAARAFLAKQGQTKFVSDTVPLSCIHKARLQWLHATNAMLADSIAWLRANGYSPEWRGSPPLTPERRDADRALHGLAPLGDAP